MPRMSITFYQDIFDQLQERAALKKISIAHYVRDLINIGFRVEEVAAKEVIENNEKDIDAGRQGTKKLWENNLNWSLESLHPLRFLIRHLIHDEKLSQENNKNYIDDVIDRAKEKAQYYVNNLFSETI